MDNLLQCIENAANQVKHKSAEASVISSAKYCPVLLRRRSYPLNKSRSKFVVVGLSGYTPFTPVIQLHGVKHDLVTLDETELKILFENRGAIANYFAKDVQLQSLNLSGSKKINFQTVGPVKVICVKDLTEGGGEIYLGVESLLELWSLQHLIGYGAEMLKTLEFSTFYTSIIKSVAQISGDVKQNIESILLNLNIKSENVECMIEMLKYCEDIIRCDIELEQYLQVQTQ